MLPNNFFKAFRAIVDCYSQAFPKSKIMYAEDRVAVYYAHITIVDAALTCYKMLFEQAKDWKMVVSLAGSELLAQGIKHTR